jgi:2,3-dimethylmalate lyase
MNMTSKGKILRELFEKEKLVVAPGAYDALSAWLIEKAGFSCVYMTGYGVSASLLGKPDIGLVTMSEMVASAGYIANRVSLPVIADGDNGYGGPLNVMRVVQLYIKAGVAAIQMEDQVTPKRCGHMEDKELIRKDEMVAKIKAASFARNQEDPDFVIIARTDALAVNGMGDALDRANAYVEAGADVIYVEAPQSLADMREIVSKVNCKWLMTIMVEGGKTPILSNSEIESIGFKFVINPCSTIFTATKAIREVLSRIKAEGTVKNSQEKMVTFDDFNELIQLEEHRALEKSFL